jgi:hypothetical protein
MRALRLLAVSLVLSSFWALAAAQEGLTDRQLKLLKESNFLLQNDGTVRHPSNSESIGRGELPYLLQRLESSQRLKALLKLNIILNKSEGEKNLTPSERESIREVVRENWPLLAYSTRKDFKSYFSLQELEQMDAELPPASISAWPMKDPFIPEPALTSEAPAPAPAAPEPAQAPALVAANTILPAVLMPAHIPTPTLTIPPAAAPVPAEDLGVLKPWNPSQAAVAPAAVATPVTILPPPPSPAPETPAAGFIFGQGPAPVPPVLPAPPVEVPPTLMETPSAAPAPRPTPGLEEITTPDLEKFLLQAPYGRDAKAMIRLISEHTPAPARARALNTLRFSLPQVSLDPQRAGRALRSRLEQAPADGQSPSIILRPAVTIHERKRLFLPTLETLLPDSAKGFEEAGLPAPALKALSREAPSQEEKTQWGQTRTFEDGSRRVTFTLEQQAGLLLAELLRLDISLRGQNASPYNTEIFARTAQMIFYARLQAALSNDRFLDPELRLDLRRWLDHPSEYRDHLVHTLNPARPARKAERSALTLYEATGLFDGAQIDEARQRLPAGVAGASDDQEAREDEEPSARTQSALMLSEILTAERQFRQKREVPDEKN